jgi:hypothetical protein
MASRSQQSRIAGELSLTVTISFREIVSGNVAAVNNELDFEDAENAGLRTGAGMRPFQRRTLCCSEIEARFAQRVPANSSLTFNIQTFMGRAILQVLRPSVWSCESRKLTLP